MQEQLKAALEYRKMGFSVIPLTPGKKKPPLVEWTKYQTEKASEGQICQWWDQWPDANVGIVTGEISGFVAIDVDDSEAERKFEELLAGCDLSSIPTVKTGRQTGNGRHRLFKWPGRNIKTRTKIIPNVKMDIRGDGGYIVAPPSMHPSGKEYEWEIPPYGELPELPGTLLNLITAKNKKRKDRNKRLHERFDTAGVLEGVKYGERDDALFRFTCKLRHADVPQSDAEYLVKKAAEKCDPPYDERDPVEIVSHVYNKYPADEIENHTDAGNARRFTAHHGQDLHYSYTHRKWLVWNGIRWRKDETGQVYKKAKQTVATIYGAAAKATEDELRIKLSKHAIRSESERSLRAMVSLAQNENGIPITADQLDADLWLLNVNNGTINLRDGSLYPHRRENLITKLAPVDYHADATCPTWEKFLDQIMAGNRAMTEYLQRAAGYALTGNVSEQVLFFLYGTGANGKSTFLNTIQEMLGDYAKQAAPNLLLSKRGESHPTELADLHGSRFVVAVEVEEGRRMAEALVKQMTGGDKIKARFMRQDFFEFDPIHKLFLAANHKPLIRGTDYAIWRRIHLVPFNVTIEPANQDRKLHEKLRTELPGILVWAINGCLLWQKQGLGIPDEVAKATTTYRAEMDVLANFLQECCVIDDKERTQAQELYDAYTNWCGQNGEKYPLNQQRLSGKLKEKGYESKRGTGGRYYWHRIGLKEAAKADDFAA
jgi:putative DNA primase/helicase